MAVILGIELYHCFKREGIVGNVGYQKCDLSFLVDGMRMPLPENVTIVCLILLLSAKKTLALVTWSISLGFFLIRKYELENGWLVKIG